MHEHVVLLRAHGWIKPRAPSFLDSKTAKPWPGRMPSQERNPGVLHLRRSIAPLLRQVLPPASLHSSQGVAAKQDLSPSLLLCRSPEPERFLAWELYEPQMNIDEACRAPSVMRRTIRFIYWRPPGLPRCLPPGINIRAGWRRTLLAAGHGERVPRVQGCSTAQGWDLDLERLGPRAAERARGASNSAAWLRVAR